jgi:hypothetical protein
MAKNKRKLAVVVRPQGLLHVHVPSHTNQGGLLVLGLKSALNTLSGSISHIPNTDLSPPPTVIPTSGAGPSTVRKADRSPVANRSTSLNEFLNEDYSDEEELKEEQLNFTFSDEEYEKSSPSSPTPATPASPKGASLDPFKTGKACISHSTPPASSRWRDLFSSNRSISTCQKLMHFSNFNVIQSCPLLAEDLDHSCDAWKLCVVGYVSGKFPGYRALNNIIGNTWKCEATLTIHESGWLVYKFQNEDKFSVLCEGPYLVYGRPIILCSMTEYFDFSCSEMTQVLV